MIGSATNATIGICIPTLSTVIGVSNVTTIFVVCALVEVSVRQKARRGEHKLRRT